MKGVGCAPAVPAAERTAQLDCDTNAADWQKWSMEKRAACCDKVGCTVSESVTAAPVTVTTTASYDCADGISVWELWASSKKRFCCQRGSIPTCDRYNCDDGHQE